MSKIVPIVATILSLTLILSSCSANTAQSGESESLKLPSLSAAQDVRDQIARSESAISESTELMSKLATECEQCQLTLTTAKTDAESRLKLSGGLWNPWPDASQSESLPQPAEIGDAPTRPETLVAYMLSTAKTQLDLIATTDGISGEDAQTLASILGGRIASARKLSTQYGIDESSAISAFPLAAKNTSVGKQSDSETSSVPTIESQKNTESQSGMETDVKSTALLTYDCVSTSLGMASFSQDLPNVEQKLNSSLITRQEELISIGANDGRPVRCVLGSDNSTEIFTSLIGADLSLVGSDNLSVRKLGCEYYWQDLQAWLYTGQVDSVKVATTIQNNQSQSDDADTKDDQ